MYISLCYFNLRESWTWASSLQIGSSLVLRCHWKKKQTCYTLRCSAKASWYHRDIPPLFSNLDTQWLPWIPPHRSHFGRGTQWNKWCRIPGIKRRPLQARKTRKDHLDRGDHDPLELRQRLEGKPQVSHQTKAFQRKFLMIWGKVFWISGTSTFWRLLIVESEGKQRIVQFWVVTGGFTCQEVYHKICNIYTVCYFRNAIKLFLSHPCCLASHIRYP